MSDDYPISRRDLVKGMGALTIGVGALSAEEIREVLSGGGSQETKPDNGDNGSTNTNYDIDHSGSGDVNIGGSSGTATDTTPTDTDTGTPTDTDTGTLTDTDTDTGTPTPTKTEDVGELYEVSEAEVDDVLDNYSERELRKLGVYKHVNEDTGVDLVGAEVFYDPSPDPEDSRIRWEFENNGERIYGDTINVLDDYAEDFKDEVTE